MVDFPEALRKSYQAGTFTKSQTDVWTEDSGEFGAPRRRARFTRALGSWSFTLLMTSEQADVLESFYSDDLEKGVLEFNWRHPRTNVLYTVRFASYPEPKELYGGRHSADVTLREI